MDELFGSQPLYWEQREKVLERHPIQFRYPQILTPGTTEVTEMLCRAGLQLAVVSNSSTEVVDQALHQCGIRENFRHIFSGWERPDRKPEPALYQQAMTYFGLKAENCLVVEDSPVGIRAGKRAGLPVAALRDRDGLIDQSEADVVLLTIRDLLALPCVRKTMKM